VRRKIVSLRLEIAAGLENETGFCGSRTVESCSMSSPTSPQHIAVSHMDSRIGTDEVTSGVVVRGCQSTTRLVQYFGELINWTRDEFRTVSYADKVHV
jgi:hypothetical protein